MAFELYINHGAQRLRCGYTTGTCAALAAKGAAIMLLQNTKINSTEIITPRGVTVCAPLCEIETGEGFASCAVQKDAGDDFDATDGIMITANVRKMPSGIVIDGGEGVGRITRRGLEQAVGMAAINSVPRNMIEQQVREIMHKSGYCEGLEIIISVARGREIAEKTFNSNLGIIGGISILGTSGIVEPQSVQALLDSIKIEVKMIAQNSSKSVIITPGNYGEDFLKTYPHAESIPIVKCSNFIGETLDYAQEFGIENILLVGHIGKFVKLAGGIMNTHSRMADCRAEIFAAHAAQNGASIKTIHCLMHSVTTDECIEILDFAGIRAQVLQSILQKIEYHIKKRADNINIEAVIFSNNLGLLGTTSGAENLLQKMGEHDE